MINHREPLFGLIFLRFIAIIFVMLSHLTVMNLSFFPSTPFSHYLGFQGVELFFVLSGFLIGTILIEKIDSNLSSLTIFYIRRWLRTLPAFYVALVIFYYIYSPNQIDAMKVASFTGSLTPTDIREKIPFFEVSWSLAVEEWFYLIAGFLISLFGPRLNVLLFMWVGALVLRIFISLGDGPISYDILHAAVLLRFDALLVGIIAAWFKHNYCVWIRSHIRKLRFIYIAGLISIFVSWLFYPWIQYSSILYSAYIMPLNSIYLAILILDFSHQMYMSGSLIYKTNTTKKIITFISTISYSLYLYHLDCFLFLKKTINNTSVATLCAIIMCFIVATVSYYCIEKPFFYLRDEIFKS